MRYLTLLSIIFLGNTVAIPGSASTLFAFPSDPCARALTTDAAKISAVVESYGQLLDVLSLSDLQLLMNTARGSSRNFQLPPTVSVSSALREGFETLDRFVRIELSTPESQEELRTRIRHILNSRLTASSESAKAQLIHHQSTETVPRISFDLSSSTRPSGAWFSPDNRQILIASNDGTADFLDVSSLSRRRNSSDSKNENKHPHPFLTLGSTPDLKRIVRFHIRNLGDNSSISIINAASSEVLFDSRPEQIGGFFKRVSNVFIPGPRLDVIHQAVMSGDRTKIFTLENASKVVIRDSSSGEILREFPFAPYFSAVDTLVLKLIPSYDGSLLALIGDENYVVWSLTDTISPGYFVTRPSYRSVSFSKSGNRYAIATHSSEGIHILNPASIRVATIPRPPQSTSIYPIEFVSDDLLIIADRIAENIEAIRLWSISENRVVSTFTEDMGSHLAGTAVSDSGRWVALKWKNYIYIYFAIRLIRIQHHPSVLKLTAFKP